MLQDRLFEKRLLMIPHDFFLIYWELFSQDWKVQS